MVSGQRSANIRKHALFALRRIDLVAGVHRPPVHAFDRDALRFACQSGEGHLDGAIAEMTTRDFLRPLLDQQQVRINRVTTAPRFQSE